jgi:hypothetical protein
MAYHLVCAAAVNSDAARLHDVRLQFADEPSIRAGNIRSHRAVRGRRFARSARRDLPMPLALNEYAPPLIAPLPDDGRPAW